jgi:microsomal epoxide hydrolase
MFLRGSVFLALVVIAILPAAGAAGISSRFFTTSDGVRLHYLEAGAGATLVFVPGWSMPAEIWEPQLRHFAGRFHAVALDPRGQGRSQLAASGYTAERRARDIHELIETLGDRPVVLVGWSLGVLEALMYVRQHGDTRVAALVLVDNSIGEDPPPVSDPTFLERLKRERAKTVDRFVRGMYRTPQDEAYLRQLTEQALRLPAAAAVALLSYPYPRTFWRETVYRTDRPLLYAVNARFRGQAENLKAKRARVWTEVFVQAGHALFVDEPQRFNTLLEHFLAAEVGSP